MEPSSARGRDASPDRTSRKSSADVPGVRVGTVPDRQDHGSQGPWSPHPAGHARPRALSSDRTSQGEVIILGRFDPWLRERRPLRMSF